MDTQELITALRQAIAVKGAVGDTAAVADIGMALLGLVDEARDAYREARKLPTTPRSGEDIGHAFGDIPLCRDCSMEVGLGQPFCGECRQERIEAALERLNG